MPDISVHVIIPVAVAERWMTIGVAAGIVVVDGPAGFARTNALGPSDERCGVPATTSADERGPTLVLALRNASTPVIEAKLSSMPGCVYGSGLEPKSSMRKPPVTANSLVGA